MLFEWYRSSDLISRLNIYKPSKVHHLHSFITNTDMMMVLGLIYTFLVRMWSVATPCARLPQMSCLTRCLSWQWRRATILPLSGWSTLSVDEAGNFIFDLLFYLMCEVLYLRYPLIYHIVHEHLISVIVISVYIPEAFLLHLLLSYTVCIFSRLILKWNGICIQ